MSLTSTNLNERTSLFCEYLRVGTSMLLYLLLSARLLTSFARTVMTGTSSVTTLLTPRPRERPWTLCRRQIKRSRATRMSKLRALSLLSCSSKRTLIILSSFPSNTMTSGGCTRRPKPPFGLLKKSNSQAMPWTGTDSWRRNNTSSYMFSPSSRPPAASSTRILVATSQLKSHHWKPDASMASRSPLKTSTARLLLIDMYIKDLTKKMHLLRVIKTIPCVQRKAQWVLKWCNSTATSFAKCMIAFAAVEGIFFWAPSVPSSGWKSEVWCQNSASAMNWSATKRDYTATVHAFCTRSWSISFQSHASSRS